MKHRQFNFLFLALVLLSLNQCTQPHGKKTTDNLDELLLQQIFKYTGDGSVIVSGHRGAWRNSPYPDNSLEGMQYAAEQVPGIFFEIDPRLTKDSVIVLMHDAKLERTTNGVGTLADYTFSALDTIRLKDDHGNVTSFKIPTLEEVIRWSIGKAVLNLDRKDVPHEMIVDLIRKCDAERHIMLTVHSGAQARYYYDRLPDVMFSAHIRNQKEYDDYVISGVPWKNMIAYVGATIDENNRDLVDKLHAHGVRCMVSFSPTHDRLESAGERAMKYEEELSCHPDIIETDYPIEVWKVVSSH